VLGDEMGLGIFDLTKCSDLGYKDRIDIYKETGVGELSLYIDNDYMQEGEDYNLIIAYARDNGLKINQVHIDYKQSNLICDETTDSFFEYISKKAHECMMLNIPYMVLHPSKGENPPEISQKQLDKLKMVVSKFPNVMFCFENVRSIKNLKKILALDVNNIKACYDLGHAHAYYDEFELFDELKNKIICITITEKMNTAP